MEDLEKKKEAFAELLEVIATLRVECPWDRKQTMESLRALSIEEVYELGDAILTGDMAEVKKELGDLLMHIVFYAQIGSEKEAFDITDVLNSICEKLKYRHPHIYGGVKVDSAEEVLQNWEQLKLKEKGRKHRVLEGVPVSLPALVKAYRIQDKARGAGFDWKQKDFLFSVINAARLYGINPENALEKTNRKFISRFGYVEDKAKETGKNLSDMSLEEMEVYWQEAKGREQK